MKKLISLLTLFYLLAANPLYAQQRFPKPEFESGYEQPSVITPTPRSLALEYFDVAVLLGVLILASWLVLKKRSRQGILWLSIFTLLYFGFYREGCICSVGSIQNVVLSFSGLGYAISGAALLFFLLPLIFALFFGRTFCAGACPLGVIQDLVIVQPISLPFWLRKTLGLIPYIYLALAVLYAATGTDFIICRYDPFVGIYRLNAPSTMVALGGAFLLIGMFVGRPYCRFLCPYGVLLKWMSKFSRWHMTITPSHCIQCKLCTTSCPFDAIDYPTAEKTVTGSRLESNKFMVYALMIPLWIAAGGFVGMKSHTYLSRANQDVYLAELMISRPEITNDPNNLDVQTFLSSGRTLETLIEDARIVRQKFYTGSMLAGAFIGLVIALMLLNQVIYRRRTDYQPNSGDCFSCARCMDYCPVTLPKK